MAYSNHWLFYFALLIPAYLLEAAVRSDWANAAGYVLVPAVIGIAIIKTASARGSLIGGYLIFMLLLFYMAGKSAWDALQDMKAEATLGCMEASAANMLFPNEQNRNTYCSCISDKIALPVLFHTGVSFLTFRELEPITSNPTLAPKAQAAVDACYAFMNSQGGL